jgi:glycosyltransferase involved in cell wall biosynthesis
MPFRNPLTPGATPLRVGYVLKRFPRLSQTFIRTEIVALERRGVDVSIASLLPPLEADWAVDVSNVRAGVTVLREGRAADAPSLELQRLTPGIGAEKRRRLASWVDALCRCWEASPPDLIHAHFGSDAATVALLGGQRLGRPATFTAHARDIFKTYVDDASDRAMRRAKIEMADAVVTVSDFNVRYLMDLCGPQSPSTIRRIYNGLPLEQVPFAAAQGREPGLILAVGRLIEKKGFASLLHALAILRSSGLSCRAEIVGDGPLAGPLRDLAALLQLQHDVTFTGARPAQAVLERMRSASVFALPCVVARDGDRDGLPTVLIEAMASGLPCVSTRVAGISELIEDGRTGRLVAPDSPAELAEAIGMLLTRPELANNCRRNARMSVERDFDITTNVGALHDLFQTVVRRHGRGSETAVAAE